MKHIDLPYICTVIGNLAGIPIRLFKRNELSFFHSLVRLPKDPMEVYRTELWQITNHVGYYVTPHFTYYGLVNSGENKIIIGPTSQVSANDQQLRELAFQADVPPEEVDDFMAGMKSIVPMPLESILQILCTINYILNDEKLGLEDIALYDSQQSSFNDQVEHQLAEQSFAHLPSDQAHAVHNTLELEDTLMAFVRKGDTAALQQWVANAPAVRGGDWLPISFDR